MYKKIETDIGGKTLTFETGKLAKQADGSVVVSCGDTMILVTAVAEKVSKNMGFLPLTIEYQERMYAAGRTGRCVLLSLRGTCVKPRSLPRFFRRTLKLIRISWP